jgi:hypothetical protein
MIIQEPLNSHFCTLVVFGLIGSLGYDACPVLRKIFDALTIEIAICNSIG